MMRILLRSIVHMYYFINQVIYYQVEADKDLVYFESSNKRIYKQVIKQTPK
jgi:hypothetical protein